MAKIKFPPLHKGLTKISDDLFIPSDYLYVRDYHVISFQEDYIILFDLRTEFSVIRDNADEALDSYLSVRLDILNWLDRKWVSSAFWNELVSADELYLQDSHIVVNNKGIEKLLYLSALLDDQQVIADQHEDMRFNDLKSATVKPAMALPNIAIPFNVLQKINLMTGSLLNNDSLVIDSLGQDYPVRFSFKNHRHIFGIIAMDIDALNELFDSVSMEAFMKALKD